MSKTKDLAQSSKFKMKALALEGERKLRVIATSPSLDRDKEHIDSDTIRVPLRAGSWKYLKDMTVLDKPDIPFLVDHFWDIEKQAGSLDSLVINDEGMTEAIVNLSTVDNGERVYTLAKEGHLGNSFSIGFSLMDATFNEGTWYNIELIELSAVAKGSNPDARLLEVKSVKETSMTEAEKLKAEIEAKQKELADVEAKEAEVVETEVEATEEKTEVEAVAEPEAPVVEEEAEVTEAEAEVTEEVETKSEKESEMTEQTKAAVKTIDAPTQEIVEAPAVKKLDKVDFAAKQFVAWVNKDHKTLSELNEQAIKSYADQTGTKETYLNAGTLADGGAIVPDARLMADVLTTLGVYSQVAQDLRVITLTEGDSLDIASLVQDVVVSEVSTEGGVKPVTKPVFGQDNLALREFAGIAIMTKKLVRQAAVNVYDLLRESFSRAVAQQRAELALTDSESGIVNQVGVVSVETADAEGIPTWAELKKAPYRVPVAAVSGAKYYISREALEALDTTVNDLTGESIDILELDGAEGMTGRFKNGFQFAVEEELGQGDNPHVVFGAMGRFGILLRQGTVESETFDTGIVVDGSEVSHNLLQQNKLAHRVAFYENVGYPLPGAFAIFEPAAS